MPFVDRVGRGKEKEIFPSCIDSDASALVE